MVAQVSNELEEALFGDAAILGYLADCEMRFKSGDRSVLFLALKICARSQAVIPEWAADAMIKGDDELNSGERKDFNELFGWTGPNQRKRKLEATIEQNAATVIAKLIAHRIEGGSLSTAEACGYVAEDTGLPRRIVEQIYRRYGCNIKGIPQGNPEGGGHISIRSVLSWPRRYGRPIL